MAKQTTVSFVDDLDGSEAKGTVPFGLDGKEYEIDLSELNEGKLREALAPFIEHARKAHGKVAKSSGRKSTAPAGSDRERNQAIREWGLAKGLDVNARGRLKKEVIEAYDAEHGTAANAVVEAPVVEDAAQGSSSLVPEFANA